MLLTVEKGVLKVSADTYSLAFAPDRPFVYLYGSSGVRLAELFIFSGVHPLHGRDDVTGTLSWDGSLPVRETLVRLTNKHVPWETSETPGEITLSLAVQSSVWASKTYRFRCLPRRFSYEIEVEGDGQLCEVNYFGGYYSGQLRWGSGFFWSGQGFKRGFNPEPTKEEVNYFAPGEGSMIDLMGVPLPGRDNWFFTPPPFCYAFEADRGWLGLGVEAGPGQNRFTEYGYHGRNGGFYLSLSYEGHTTVDGRYRLPAIGFDFAADEYGALEAHVQALIKGKYISRAERGARPSWWHEPIYCGWGSQCYLAALDKGQAPDYARQAHYDKFLDTLDANGVHPGIVVLDDKWQATYGDNQVDEQKWPDLPGFIAGQHAKGRKVLLWLKAWDPQGVPAEECITNASGLPLAVDPTNPAYQQRLRAAVRRMLSPDGYDADGFKIDFTARIPSGPGIRVCEDSWGLELMKCYLALLYEEAKLTKPDALVMAHTPHPYLADVVDMIRLNDMNPDKDVRAAMMLRARIVEIACPEAIIDTDNWPIKDLASWRSYLRLQPSLGVPSLYYASHIDSTKEPLGARDYRLIREVWARHRARTRSSTEGTKGSKDSQDRTRRNILSSWRLQLLLRLSLPAFRRGRASRGQAVS
jgi:hypothetical protein